MEKIFRVNYKITFWIKDKSGKDTEKVYHSYLLVKAKSKNMASSLVSCLWSEEGYEDKAFGLPSYDEFEESYGSGVDTEEVEDLGSSNLNKYDYDAVDFEDEIEEYHKRNEEFENQ